jgi:hypothetical protein
VKNSIRLWWNYTVIPSWNKTCDQLCMFLVWNCLPARLLSWATIRVVVTAARDDQNPGEVIAADALKKWNP